MGSEIIAYRPGDLAEVLLPGAGYARVNWGRWIIDCSSPACTSALATEPGVPGMRCWDCGFVTAPIVWPPDPEAIEALLAARPDEKTRNWEHGETLRDLLVENAAHGILPPTDPTLMITEGERVLAGSVGALFRSDIRRHQIEAESIKAIEGRRVR